MSARDPRSAAAGEPARRGLWSLVGAFAIWGLLPLYLRQLRGVSPLEITAHRVVWCAVFVVGWLGFRGELPSLRTAIGNGPVRSRLAASATLIAANWLTYVWAVGNGRVVDASLGYFINPLVNVLLGVAVLRERLNRAQWISVALAAAGVAHLTWLAGGLPWIALVLATSFGTYGLIRKTVAVDALAGLGAETLFIAPFGAAYLVFLAESGRSAISLGSPAIDALLVGGGPITAVPLFLFAYGARRVRYSTVGLLQYFSPTMQLLLGIFVFGEPFGLARATGFILIWSALAVYAVDGALKSRGA